VIPFLNHQGLYFRMQILRKMMALKQDVSDSLTGVPNIVADVEIGEPPVDAGEEMDEHDDSQQGAAGGLAGGVSGIDKGWSMADLSAYEGSVDTCLRDRYPRVFYGIVNRGNELIAKAADALEKLGLPKAGRELARRFQYDELNIGSLDELDDVDGLETKELLCTVKYGEPQVSVLILLLRACMTVIAARVARKWKSDLDAGK